MLRQELASAERDAVNVAQERIKQVKVELAAANKEADVPGREAVGPNPLREGLERDLVASRAQEKALASQRDTLRQQAREAAVTLASLRDKKVGVERLQRDVTVARDTYMTHARRLEEARIAAGLDKQQLSDIAIIEQPYATGDTDFFRRVVIVLLGCVVGVGLGVAAAFCIEFFNNSVRTTEDVEFYVGLPVVATIPALPGTPVQLAAPRPPVALKSGARPDRGSSAEKGNPS
jgi:uncharacterized protein involved in exopolysaccharide biosynthesis